MADARNKISAKESSALLSEKSFVKDLMALRSPGELEKIQRFYRDSDEKNKFIGARMADIFKLAKKYSAMPMREITKLLDSDYYEIRMGAVSMMDLKARNKKSDSETKKALFDLYIKKHDRINNWDLVDRSAPYVVGGYLFDKPRNVLYKLAKSKNVWERRTAIVSTYFFIRQNELDDTFAIAAILIHDKHDLINKAVGSWVREAGKRDRKKLIDFLNAYAGSMPRITLRYAIEKLDNKTRQFYLDAGKGI